MKACLTHLNKLSSVIISF